MEFKIYRSKEEELLKGCLKRDRNAQKQLYNAYSGKMYSICFRYVKNSMDAEDVLVTAFTKVFDKIDQFKDHTIDSQCFSPAWYNDPLMNGLLYIKLHLIEKESNVELFQKYGYWRYYVFGATLSKHTDRPSCEISVTACIKKYDNWPLIIEGTEFELEEGDGLLYAGCDQEHGRPGIYKGEGMAQVFFHYVNKNGRHTKDSYDNFLKTTGKKNE